jgi:hypothetical protein
MRGLQYYHDDDIIVTHLVKAYGVARNLEYVRALARNERRYISGNLNDIERIGKRIEEYGEEVVARRYGLQHYNLFGIEPHLEAARVGFDSVVAFIHERTMQNMPAVLTPEQKKLRLHDMMFPEHPAR